MYVCMYVSVTLRNPIISCATRKRSITYASVTLRNVTAVRSLRRQSCRTKLTHCKQISACSERELDYYSQRHCTHTPQRRPDSVGTSSAVASLRTKENFNILYTVRLKQLLVSNSELFHDLGTGYDRCARLYTAYSYL